MTAQRARTIALRSVLLVGCAAGLAALAACTSSGGPSAGASATPPSTAAARGTPAVSSTASPGGAGTAGGTSSESHPNSTARVTVTPVTSDGRLASGWSAHAESTSIDCSAGMRSPVAESNDVLYCAPSAASAVACWHASDPAFAYCLTDPRGHTLVRYPLMRKAFPAAGPTELEARPDALDLADGTQCSIRDSGAAGDLGTHPDWVPYYFCGHASQLAVWAPQNSVTGGITHGDGAWTVQVAAGDGTTALRTVPIATAYYAGTGR